jgi:DNA-binding NtrC family response regulator
MRLQLPDLRDRREDIPLLTGHFTGRFNRLHNKDISGVSDDVLNLLMRYDFPGNARELENIIEHAFVLCRGGLIELRHLPPEVLDKVGPPAVRVQPGTTLRAIEALHISDALRRNGGNRKAAAEELGIHPSTLLRKIRTLGVELPDHDGRSGRHTKTPG